MVELRLSYDELGQRLGIKPEAARQRAKRRQREGRWRIIVDNSGRAVVHLDETDLAAEPTGRSPDHRPNERPDAADHLPDDRVELLAELVGRAERAERKLAQVEGKMEELVVAARREVDAARQAAEEARVGLAQLQGETAGIKATALADVAAAARMAEAEIAAQAALVEELRATLAQARMPWWRRLLAR